LTDDRPSAPAIPQIRLRIVQTTDLHMHLLAYDYDLLRPSGQRGLANLIAPITALRADDTATLLFDCGDFLQGSPLADTAAQAPGPHPMITAMNALGYDAIVLGNHDFDYGLDVLKDALADLTCPVLGANVQLENAPPLTQPTAIIPVTSGKHSLRVPEGPHIAPEMGRLHNKPAMMAGAFGSHLGVMDLTAIQRDDRSWKISDADVRVLLPIRPRWQSIRFRIQLSLCAGPCRN